MVLATTVEKNYLEEAKSRETCSRSDLRLWSVGLNCPLAACRGSFLGSWAPKIQFLSIERNIGDAAFEGTAADFVGLHVKFRQAKKIDNYKSKHY